MENPGYLSDSQESFVTAASFSNTSKKSNNSTAADASSLRSINENAPLQNISRSQTINNSSNSYFPNQKSGLEYDELVLKENLNPAYDYIHEERNGEVSDDSDTISLNSQRSQVTSVSISTTTTNLQQQQQAHGNIPGRDGPRRKSIINKQNLNQEQPTLNSDNQSISSKFSHLSHNRHTSSQNKNEIRNYSNLLNCANLNLPSSNEINKFKKLEKFLRDNRSKYLGNSSNSSLYKINEIKLLKEFTIILSQACHIFCLLLPAIMAFLVTPGSSNFSWHPFLMMSAYSFISMQAILLFAPDNVNLSSHIQNPLDEHVSPLQNVTGTQTHSRERRKLKKKQIKTRLHWILQLISTFFVGLAFYSIYIHKERLHKSHFTTIHAKFGFITLTLTSIQVLFGIPMILPIIRQKLLNFTKSYKIVKPRVIHAILGVLVIIFASVSQILAINSQWFKQEVHHSWLIRFGISFLLGSQIVVVVNQVIVRYFESLMVRRSSW